jgi:hypothetical protein
VEFQPSIYSDDAYAGWLENLTSKEGRAENKRVRSEKAAKKGWKRIAAHTEQRAAVLELKASGKKQLSLKSSPKKLWASEYPWPDRQGAQGRRIVLATAGAMALEKLSQPIAKGMRPSAEWHGREFRTTIIGGLKALQHAGVQGYTEPEIGSLDAVQATKRADPMLLGVTGQPDLPTAARFIRQKVIQHKLADAAWGFRAVQMIQPAVVSASVRAAGAGVASAVVPMPWGLIPMAVAAQEGAHSAVLQQDIAKFQTLIERGLASAGVRDAKQIAKAEIARLTQETERAVVENKEQEAIEVERLRGLSKKIGYGVLGVAGLLTVVVVVARSGKTG